MKLPFTLLLLTCTGVFWAVGYELSLSEPAASQKAYTLEQSKIDLTLAEFALEAVNGTTPAEVVQDKIDQWVRDNDKRLLAQAELAAELDHSLPLALDSKKVTSHDSAATPSAARLQALESLEEQRIAELRTRARSPEDLQVLVDEWSRSGEGQAVFTEKTSLIAISSGQQPLGTLSAIPDIPLDASPDEKAVLEIEEKMARRVEEIRLRNPNADPEKMQSLIAGISDEIEVDHKKIGELMQNIRRSESIRNVERLRAEVLLNDPVQSD